MKIISLFTDCLQICKKFQPIDEDKKTCYVPKLYLCQRCFETEKCISKSPIFGLNCHC